jgi:Rieske Fe-S protein
MSPEAGHLHVITGLRKWGLTNGTAGALILADTLSGRHNPWAAVFDSNRRAPASTLRAAGPAGGAGVPPAGPAKPEPREQAGVAGLRPGEGIVVDVDGAATAVYAAEFGKLHAVSAICTHLGCTVEFNAEDTTWDCPCHGSRFATDGTVIQGPATENLAAGPSPSRPAGPVPG